MCIRDSRDFAHHDKLYYLLWPFALTFLFFLYSSCFKKSEVNWAAPAYISAGILLAYWLVTYKCRKTYVIGLLLSVIVILVVKVPWAFPFMPNRDVLLNKFLGYRSIMTQAAPYYRAGDVVLSDAYQRAAEASFYLPGQPPVYIITPTRFSQYTLWSQPVKQAILNGKIRQVLYIGDISQRDSLFHFFKRCHLLKHLDYTGRFNTRQRVLLRCTQ